VSQIHNCIIPKPGKPAISRPNGSKEGQEALSRTSDLTEWNPLTNPTGNNCTSTGANNVNGSIDFSRSSSGPAVAGTGPLNFYPVARDGVSYAYYDHGTNELASLSSTQLQDLYGGTNAPGGPNIAQPGTITVNGHTVHACMVQQGSGTGKFWDKALGNAGDGATANQSAINGGCNALVGTPPTEPTYEENGYNSWLSAVIALYGTGTDDAIIPFSAGQWIAQNNQASVDRSCLGRPAAQRPATCPANPTGWATPIQDQLGTIDGNAPFTLTGTTESPGTAFYASTSAYGRDTYVVLLQSKVGAFGDRGLKSLFTDTITGETPAICTASATATKMTFGFLAPAATCGHVFTTGALVANT
jgi:hypothetical protein